MGTIDMRNIAYILPLLVSLTVGAKDLNITTSLETRTSIFKSCAEDDHLSNSLILNGPKKLSKASRPPWQPWQPIGSTAIFAPKIALK